MPSSDTSHLSSFFKHPRDRRRLPRLDNRNANLPNAVSSDLEWVERMNAVLQKNIMAAIHRG
jgi:hypothetical protein